MRLLVIDNGEGKHTIYWLHIVNFYILQVSGVAGGESVDATNDIIKAVNTIKDLFYDKFQRGGKMLLNLFFRVMLCKKFYKQIQDVELQDADFRKNL